MPMKWPFDTALNESFVHLVFIKIFQWDLNREDFQLFLNGIWSRIKSDTALHELFFHF